MPAVSQHVPVSLTQAQCKVVAEIAPTFADQLRLEERNQRSIPFTLAELKAIKQKVGQAIQQASTGMVRNSLRHVTDLAAQAVDRSRGLGAIPVAERGYQFRISQVVAQLVQTEATVQWAIKELHREEDHAHDLDSFFPALSRLLCNADPHLLQPRADQILQAPGFFKESSGNVPLTGSSAANVFGQRRAALGGAGPGREVLGERARRVVQRRSDFASPDRSSRSG